MYTPNCTFKKNIDKSINIFICVLLIPVSLPTIGLQLLILGIFLPQSLILRARNSETYPNVNELVFSVFYVLINSLTGGFFKVKYLTYLFTVSRYRPSVVKPYLPPYVFNKSDRTMLELALRITVEPSCLLLSNRGLRGSVTFGFFLPAFPYRWVEQHIFNKRQLLLNIRVKQATFRGPKIQKFALKASEGLQIQYSALVDLRPGSQREELGLFVGPDGK